MGDLKWFIGVLILIGFVWLVTGGPERASSNDPFIHQPNPVGEGGTYSRKLFPNLSFFPSGNLTRQQDQAQAQNDIKEALENSGSNTTSPYNGYVTLARASATRDEADEEYVRIDIDRNLSEAVVIDGWKLRSTITGAEVSLGGASYLPRLGGNNQEFTIKANPGDEIIVTTGRSPIGVSFRTNICIGYLEQYQDFSPSLPRQCPRADNEIPPQYEYGSGPNAFNDECVTAIERIGLCKINTAELPRQLQPQCREFIAKSLNYNGCVDLHSNESTFYGDEWRIYIGRSSELWKERREAIELVDANNKVIDSITY